MMKGLNQWMGKFKTADINRSGTIEYNELDQAIHDSWGYKLSPHVIEVIIKR